MKKIISIMSLVALMGFNSLSIQHSSLDLSSILNADQEDGAATYIVTVAGDVDDADAYKNRQKVMNQVRYLLGDADYEITHVYDTVMNGFSIKFAKASDAKVLNSISGIRDVQKSHTYARPTTAANYTTYANGKVLATEDYSNYSSETTREVYLATKAAKLANYSAETMAATNANVKNVTGQDSYLGKGIKVGVADTGLFLNQVEGTSYRQAFLDSEETFTDGKGKKTIKYSEDYRVVDPAFTDLDSTKLTSDSLTLESITNLGFVNDTSDDGQKSNTSKTKYFHYINNKIPFAYDFADNDTNVDPSKGTEDNVHGTHVASTAVANGNEYQGIAPDAQLAVFKIFGDNASGAGSDAIVAALETAVKLNLDVINYSIGSDLTDYNADDNSADARMYSALTTASEKGLIVNFSAGNAGKGSYAGDMGYADWTNDTVETGILGDNASSDEYVNVVAATAPEKAFFSSVLLVGEEQHAVSFSDQATNRPNMEEKDKLETEYPLTSLLEGKSEAEFEFVRIGGYGVGSDYTAAAQAGVDVAGKIAVVDRGSATFAEKLSAAEDAKASALIVINNVAGASFNMNMDFGGKIPHIPVVFVFQSTRSYFGEINTKGKLTLGSNTVKEAPDANVFASFTSNGIDAVMDIAPTIGAPGSLIMGAVNADYKGTDVSGTTSWESGMLGYENMSGTSMAAPNLTGAMALTLGEKKNAAGVSTTDYEKYRKNMSKMAMSTADMVLDNTAVREVSSVRVQGAGRINVERLLTADSYVTTTLNDDGMEDAKAELKNNGTLNADLTKDAAAYIEIPYTIHNESGEARTYKPSLSLMIPTLRIQKSKATYDGESADSRKDTALNLVSTITQSMNDDVITIDDAQYQDVNGVPSTKEITVAARGTASGTMKVRIDNIAISRKFSEQDALVSDFSGTLREYFNQYFNQGESAAGGSFVEGFLKFTSTTDTTTMKDLSIPYLGFYGDYTKGSIVEPFEFEKEEGHLYNSELIDSRKKNLSSTYARVKAYTGSTLATHKGALSSEKINNIGDLATAATATVDGEFGIATPDGSHLDTVYAGSENATNLVATFFVNRTVKASSWSIKKNGTKVSGGNIQMLYSKDGTSYAAGDNGGILEKSWLSENMTVARGFADISVKNLAEGTYELSFDFTGVSGARQTKTYKLVIDKTNPTLRGASVEVGDSASKLNLSTDADVVYLNGVGYKVNNGSVSMRLNSRVLASDTAYVELQDYAGNKTTLIFNPTDFRSMIVGSGLTDNEIYSLDLASNKGGIVTYGVTVMDKDFTPVDIKSDLDVIIHIGEGLNASALEVLVDGIAVTDYSYDAASGNVIVHLPEGSVEIGLNYMVVNLGDAPKAASGNSGSTSTSTATSDATSTAETKKKCGGSIIATSSAIGAAALLATGLLLKKKRDDKEDK